MYTYSISQLVLLNITSSFCIHYTAKASIDFLPVPALKSCRNVKSEASSIGKKQTTNTISVENACDDFQKIFWACSCIQLVIITEHNFCDLKVRLYSCHTFNKMVVRWHIFTFMRILRLQQMALLYCIFNDLNVYDSIYAVFYLYCKTPIYGASWGKKIAP